MKTIIITERTRRDAQRYEARLAGTDTAATGESPAEAIGCLILNTTTSHIVGIGVQYAIAETQQ